MYPNCTTRYSMATERTSLHSALGGRNEVHPDPTAYWLRQLADANQRIENTGLSFREKVRKAEALAQLAALERDRKQKWGR